MTLIDPPLKLSRLALLAPFFVLAAMLGGCGGGSSNPSIASIVANPPMYGRTLTISVEGSALTGGIGLSVDGGCDNLTPVPNGTDALQQYTCKVSTVGTIRASVTGNSDGREIGSLKITIPTPQVTVTTTMGAFSMELDPLKAPKTVTNFLAYVNGGFYTGVIFHRVISNFVIQTGGYTTGLKAKTNTLPAIPLESNNGLSNLQYTVGMARLAAPNTATSQFYINVVDNSSTLDYVDANSPGYAVFGKVISGTDVIDAIKAVPTQTDATTKLPDVPVTDVTVQTAVQIR